MYLTHVTHIKGHRRRSRKRVNADILISMTGLIARAEGIPKSKPRPAIEDTSRKGARWLMSKMAVKPGKIEIISPTLAPTVRSFDGIKPFSRIKGHRWLSQKRVNVGN